MTASDTHCEVVWIMDRNRLVDAESYERIYGLASDEILPQGYYVARWPSGTTNPHFLHDGLRFSGPYGSWHDAEAALAGAALGDRLTGGQPNSLRALAEAPVVRRHLPAFTSASTPQRR